MSYRLIFQRFLFGVVGVIFVPLFKDLLPVDGFAVGYSFGLAEHLVAHLFFGMACLHGFYCGFVKHLYAAAAYAFVKVYTFLLGSFCEDPLFLICQGPIDNAGSRFAKSK